MQSYKILKTDVKSFMPKLLVKDTFDLFEVRNVEIVSFAEFSINSILTKKEDEEVLTWEKIRPIVYNIIKGAVLPKQIKVVFCLKKDELINISDNLSSCFLNLLYENEEVMFTTGTSQKTFSLEKKEDIIFDEFVEKYFKDNEIMAINVKKL